MALDIAPADPGVAGETGFQAPEDPPEAPWPAAADESYQGSDVHLGGEEQDTIATGTPTPGADGSTPGQGEPASASSPRDNSADTDSMSTGVRQSRRPGRSHPRGTRH